MILCGKHLVFFERKDGCPECAKEHEDKSSPKYKDRAVIIPPNMKAGK